MSSKRITNSSASSSPITPHETLQRHPRWQKETHPPLATQRYTPFPVRTLHPCSQMHPLPESSDLPNVPKEDGEFYRYLAKIIINIVSGALKDDPQREWYLMLPSDLGEFARKALEQKYPWAYVKKIVEMHVDNNKYWPCITFAELQELYPCEVISDFGALHIICDKVLADQPHAVQDYKKGKLAAMNRLKGLVMKETKGKADISIVERMLIDKMLSL